MMTRLLALCTLSSFACANAQIVSPDRALFLNAVKARLHAEPAYLQPIQVSSTPSLEADWRLLWDSDLMQVPGLDPFLKGRDATFSVALAYLASKETNIPFLATKGKRDEAFGYLVKSGHFWSAARKSEITLNAFFLDFGRRLVPEILDDKASCGSQGFLKFNQSESLFATSICEELQRVVSAERRDHVDQQLLLTEKRIGYELANSTKALLDRSTAHAGQPLLLVALGNLQNALRGDGISEIRTKEEALRTALRGFESPTQANETGSRPDAPTASPAKEELERSRALLLQTKNFEQEAEVKIVQESLERSLAENNLSEIDAQVRSLIVLDQALQQNISNNALAKTSGSNLERRPVSPDEVPENRKPSADRGKADDIERASWFDKFLTAAARRSDPKTIALFLLIAIGLDWIYCLIRGLNDTLVLYFDNTDAFISVVGPVLLVVFTVALVEDWRPLLIALFGSVGMLCVIWETWTSIRHNRSIFSGLAVGFFKLSFSFLWFLLLFGQIGRGSNKKQSAAEREREQALAIIIAWSLLMLMRRLINGSAVYEKKGWLRPGGGQEKHGVGDSETPSSTDKEQRSSSRASSYPPSSEPREEEFSTKNSGSSGSNEDCAKSRKSDGDQSSKSSNEPDVLNEAFCRKVLEVSANSGREEVRAVYRSKLAEYHPDKVAHLGPELRVLADRKTREIIDAFNYLDKNRCFR